MKFTIEEVKSGKQLKEFVYFPEKLFKDAPNWVPPLYADEFGVLSRNNPAFEFCDAVYWLARDERGAVIGRIAGIVNHNANRDWNESIVRFGWLDFVEDEQLLRALVGKVADWGRSKGMTKMKGPLGFSDMDKEGLLVDGFENLSPSTCIYNFPYYGELLEKVGFRKDTDWTQRIIELSGQLPPMFRYADLVKSRFGLKEMPRKKRKELFKTGYDLFHVLNDSFSRLYEFTRLSEKQIDVYVKQYIPFINQDLSCFILNEKDEVVGFCICIPSLSNAYRKSHGRLFPFGFIPILSALKKNDTLEALLIGVLPEYQGKGANVLIFKHIHEGAIKFGIKRMILNPQLEDNAKVQTLFGDYEAKPFMRRRSYLMDLTPGANAANAAPASDAPANPQAN